jgi:acyl-coenzyme A synthetase/AMP-(fatty) acid ligase
MTFPPWRWDIPEQFNIGVACTDAHAGGPHAGRAAMVVHDATTGIQERSFAELADDTSRFAAVLEAFGVDAGERVLIRLPNCIEYPIAFLGTLKRGAIAVPTSILLTGEEVLHLATDSGAVAMVTDAATWAAAGETLRRHVRRVFLVDGDASGVHALGAALASARPAPPHPTRAEDPAYLVYTSGSTGYPKGVLHAHRALLGRQPSSEYWFDFQPDGDRVLHSGKLNWTYVLGTGMMDPLHRGHTAILHEGPSDPTLWPRLIAAQRATTFIGVPTLYRQIVEKTAAGGADVPTLRHCMSAGEQLSDRVLEAWRARFGLEIYEGLGMTECSYYLCQTKSRPIRPGSAGFAQPGHDVAVLAPDTLGPVPDGEEGVLCIPRTDPGLMLAYWNQPEETARHLRDGWFVTGDYARRDADGYVWFLGRKDDLIKSFGYRVSPHEVDRVLKDHPDVAEVATVGETSGPEKVLVVSYVIPRPGRRADPEAILGWAREHLASYKAPKRVYVVDDFPRTRNGKVLRRGLRPPGPR